MRRALALAALALLSAAPWPVGAQEALLPPRRLALFFDTAASSRFTDDQRRLLYESLLIRLGRASQRVYLLEAGSGRGANDEQLTRDAQELLGDSWIHVTVDGDWQSLQIAVRSFDVLHQELPLDFSLAKPLLRGAVDLERHFWDEVVDSVRQTYTQTGLPVTATVQEVALELQAAPGTRIRGFTPQPLKTGEDGTATAEVLLPATFQYRATRRGYWPLEQTVFLSPGQDSYALPQEPGPRWSLDFYLYQFGFPGFEAAWYPRRGPWYVQAGLNTFLAGVRLEGGDQEPLFVSLSLSHLNLATGLYLNDPDRRFRFYLEAGLFARLITAADFIVTIDRIAPFAFQPALGMEFGRQPRRRFFLEYAPPFYYAPRVGLMWLSAPPENRPAMLPIPFHVVDGKVEALYDWAFMWELAVFRLGVRVVL